MENYNEELIHSGIKGMKWGVRRYQNPDGSLTPAGRKHYGSGKSIGQRIKAYKTKKQRQKNLEKAREARAAKVEEKKTLEEQRAKLLKSNDAKEIYANRHLLSTAELNDRINRIDTEARLASKIVEDKQQTGLDYVNGKMQRATNTINNATNLYRSVDNAYSSVANSTIGKTLAKKLGLEPPKKEFNLGDFMKDINKKTTQEIMDVNKRLTAEEQIRKKMSDKKEQEAAAKKAEETLKEAQKQVDEYNRKLSESSSSTYSKKGKDLTNNKEGLGGNPEDKSIPRLEQINRYTDTGKKVEGKGTSRYTERQNDTVIDAEEGKDYWSVDGNYSNTSMSTATNSSSYSIGQNYISGLLEDKTGR